MQLDGAVVREQGVTFAIVVVKSFVLNNPTERESFRSSCSSVFPGVPVILMAQDSRGTPSYHGRTDIVKFLASIDPRRIPWKRYTIG
jgi:hypothetical protein